MFRRASHDRVCCLLSAGVGVDRHGPGRAAASDRGLVVELAGCCVAAVGCGVGGGQAVSAPAQVHVCRESYNPRNAGWCSCGRRLAVPSLPRRDREFERELTQRIVGALVDANALTVFSERRADRAESEYGHDFPALDRDLEMEAAEELAD